MLFSFHFLSAPAASVVTEYQLWISKWKREFKENTDTKHVVVTIEVKDDDLYPNIQTLLNCQYFHFSLNCRDCSTIVLSL